MSHILLVEDNADMQMLLCELLVYGEHTFVSGRTGLEALDILQKAITLPELIISDLNMPRMDGIELLETVRQHPIWKDIPFVIMSANVHDERLTDDILQALNGVLPKPFSLEDLNMVLSRV